MERGRVLHVIHYLVEVGLGVDFDLSRTGFVGLPVGGVMAYLPPLVESSKLPAVPLLWFSVPGSE